jgi:GNAT superfamily N-acetyltransferase
LLSVLALHEGKVAGFTTLSMSQIEGQSACIGFTAVLRPYRGKGVAFALKVTSAVEARIAGISSLRTNNDPDNPAILHLNKKMGFCPVPGPIIVKKSLTE